MSALAHGRLSSLVSRFDADNERPDVRAARAVLGVPPVRRAWVKREACGAARGSTGRRLGGSLALPSDQSCGRTRMMIETGRPG
jgi:hypothetical protein